MFVGVVIVVIIIVVIDIVVVIFISLSFVYLYICYYYIHIILFSLPLFLFFSIYLSVYLSSSPRLSSIRFFLHYFSRWFATRIPNFFSIFTHTFSLSLFFSYCLSPWYSFKVIVFGSEAIPEIHTLIHFFFPREIERLWVLPFSSRFHRIDCI